MKRRLRVAMVVATLVVAAIAAAPASAASPAQLSLGDSWGAGVGAAVPSQGGYVPRLHALLQEEFDCSPSSNPKPGTPCKKLELINLSVGGATTPTLIANQLPGAVSILQDRNGDQNPRNDVEVVTLHIGGNDVTSPIIAACLGGVSASCLTVINNEFTVYRNDLNAALSALSAVAGDARVVMGTYDNPIPTCFLIGINPAAGQLGALVLEGGGPVSQGLHDIMRDVAADHGVEVVSVFGQLAPQDWVGGADCLHPRDSGYAKVAAAFHAALTN
jgi:lysophospholipase L1-like esterase